ncbi:MAG TPA: CGNR zinc finger domain-containing protein [Lacisediminihabitans sp.]|uniref:CGNR zinc finger domain-containing protein n=1 Tax=Lacisediminihabitans sp. TaxID=2787631 RepID=UPI002EDABC00
MKTGQWFGSGASTRWWFDTGAGCLDFAYTGGMGDDPDGELFATPDDLRAWLAARFDRVDASASDRDLVDARSLRAAIAAVARTLSSGLLPAADDVDTINLFAATPDIPPSLSGGARRAGRSSVRVGQTLSEIARDAVRLFGEDAGRLRTCAADDCGLVFYDESRSNNRRWCSMQRCGNRSKVRAHRARTSG